MALFTLHTTVTLWSLFFGSMMALVVIYFGSLIIMNMIDEAKDKAYQEGYDVGYETYAAEIADDIAVDVDFFLRETTDRDEL